MTETMRDREGEQRRRKLRARNHWKNTAHSFLQCSFMHPPFCITSVCTITHTSLIPTHHVPISSPSAHIFLHPSLPFVSPFVLPPWKTCSPLPACPPRNFSFTSLLPRSLLPSHSFALPWWYLIAVKQEAGEQTAGEPTLILSCAICCSHMTEMQARSNAMMPHHTWHIDQSRPKSKTERGRERNRELEKSERNEIEIKVTLNTVCPMNETSQLWLNILPCMTCNYGISSGLVCIIKRLYLQQWTA